MKTKSGELDTHFDCHQSPAPKRVAIVTGHFMPEMGYQEVYLARAFRRLGHSVRVFCSTEAAPSGKHLGRKYAAGLSSDPVYGYEVLRSKPLFTASSNVVAKGIAAQVESYLPDVVVFIAVAKIFGSGLIRCKGLVDVRFVAVFGDSASYVSRSTAKARFRAKLHDLVFWAIKNPLYRRFFRRCDRIIANTPETTSLLRGLLSPRDAQDFDRKCVPLALGFDPDEFFFCEKLRTQARQEISAESDELVVVTSTRVQSHKQIERIVDAVDDVANTHAIHYVIAGFLEDAYAKQLKEYILSRKNGNRIHCFGFQKHDEMRRLYCGSDVGVWTKAAISIQEAMGTGLPIILERAPIVAHLLRTEAHGVFLDNWSSLPTELARMCDVARQLSERARTDLRVKLAAENSLNLSYDQLATRILEGLW